MRSLKVITDTIISSDNSKIFIKCYQDDRGINSDVETIIFLNSSFFNQDQYKKFIFKLNSILPEEGNYRYITYDYTGSYYVSADPSKYTIGYFMKEFVEVLKWSKEKNVHIFGMSIGSWLGLNLCINKPNLVKSFLGYGNLAPYNDQYQTTVAEFQKVEQNIKLFAKMNEKLINRLNWPKIFNEFYVPLIFNTNQMIENEDTVIQNARKMMLKILFPFVESLNIGLYSKFYIYLTNTIITEGFEIINNRNLKQNKIPILFLNGKKDSIAKPLMSLDLKNKISNSKLILLDNLGHGSMLLGKGNSNIMKNYCEFLINK